MREDEIRQIVRETLSAERQLHNAAEDEVVLRTVSAILKSFGIEEDDHREFRKDMDHLRKWRKSVEQAQTITFKVAISAIVTGLIGAAWLGFKTMMMVKGGG
jgi:hypothetical protein